MKYTHINNLHEKVKHMGKTLYGKYLDDVGNMGVNIPSCVLCEVWVSTSYHFQYILFSAFHVEVKGKGEGEGIKSIPKSRLTVLVESRVM